MAKAKKAVVEAMKKAVDVKEIPFQTPKNWTWARLIQLYNFIDYRGKTPTKLTEGVRLITAKNIKKGYLDYSVSDYISEEEYGERQSRGISQKGDILFTTEAPMGNVALADLDVYSAGQRVITFQKYSNTEGISNKFYYYYILSEWFQQELQKNKTGSTVEGIKAEKLMYIPVPLPPLSEQQRIVEQIENLFAKLDEAKEQVQSVLGNSEERKSAILFKAYSGALTKRWRKQNGKSQDEWRKVCLKDVCKINPPKINAKDYDDDLEVSFFPMPALSEVTGTITEPQTRKLGEVKTGFTNFSEGDVVFAKITPCMENGKSAIIGKLVNDIGYGTTEFYVMRCSDRLLNGYLYHLVRSKHFRDEAKSVMTGAVGQQRVPKSFLEEYEIKLPSIEEQEEILRIVDEMVNKEHQVAVNCECVIEQINMMKKTILAKAFRGELGTNNPDEESAVELLKQILVEDL